VILSTIEKFRLKKDAGESEPPKLSERSNVFVLADEAHRSQYGFGDGFARYLREALPTLGASVSPARRSVSAAPAFLRDLIHDVVRAIKNNLKMDWTQEHRHDVLAEMRSAIRRVLRKRGVREEDFDPFVDGILTQARATFADWPRAA